MVRHPADLLPPLNKRSLDRLREDLQAHGVVNPILVTEDDEIVDGRHRMQLAKELGIPCPVETVKGDRLELLHRAIVSNTASRKLTRGQRDDILRQLLDEGMDQRSAAALLGVSQPTVHRAMRRDSNESARSSRTMREMVPRTEMALRRAKVRELHEQGYSRPEIAVALDVKPHTVRDDVRHQALPPAERPTKLAPLGRIDYRTGELLPAPAPPPTEAELGYDPGYRNSKALPVLRHFVVTAREISLINLLAYARIHADRARDEPWLAQLRDYAKALVDYGQRLTEVVNDLDRARHFMGPEGCDDFLRARADMTNH